MDHDPFAVRRAGPRAASAAGAFALGWGVLTVPAADAAGPAMFPSTCDTPSLVRAISAANDAGGPATVRLAGNCTYLLTEPTASGGNGADGLPVITGDVTMRGTDTTIARATRAPRFRVLEIAPAAALSLDGITISGGHTAGGGTPGAPGADGGGIRNAGTLTLHRSVLTGNRTGSGADGSDGAPGADGGEAGQPGGWGARGGRGGGIYNAGGTVTLRESLVSHNRTGRGGAGGDGGHGGHGAAGGDGGYGGRGAAGGSGAGLGGSGGTVTITSSVFAHNRTGDGGPTGSGGDGGDGTTGEGGDGGKAGNGRTSASGGTGGGIAAASPLTVSGSMVYRNATGDGGDSGQAGHGGDGVTGGSGAGVWGGRAATQAGSGGDGGGIFTQRAYPTRIENSTVARNRTGDGGNGGDGGRGGNGERADGLAGSGAVGGWGGHGGGIGFGSGPSEPGAVLAATTVRDNRTGRGGDGGDAGRGRVALRKGHGGSGWDGGDGGGVHVDRKRRLAVDGGTITGNVTGPGGRVGTSPNPDGRAGGTGTRGLGGGFGAGWHLPDDPAIRLSGGVTVHANEPENCYPELTGCG
ncbi:hypothetical protein [Amycolatopsis cihanbeyliensis]|uniref:Outer membrane repeat protein n=1 Tax=Amycolatopsis cihanbeyliensis TaxID=1128664 RepID=A0A542DBM9_AMYCI|nr:hypothetical protein [Amycolatopsis cihanbeyliensis]TQJ00481.1 hypothetical protein FB471_0106 [Amycolatopsis cihanbeyliensis]